jgi:hypothetical protein
MGIATSQSVPIDELVGLLDSRSPQSLKTLQSRYPQHLDLLRPGIVAGDVSQDMQVRIEVCTAGLTAAVQACKEAIDQIRKRLRVAHSLQMYGQLSTLIAGASIFGVLAINVPTFARYSAAVVALVGSVFTYVAQQLQQSPTSSTEHTISAISDRVLKSFVAPL